MNPLIPSYGHLFSHKPGPSLMCTPLRMLTHGASKQYKSKGGGWKIKKEEVEQVDEKSAAWQRKAGKNQEGGLNAAGRKSYERENPGSDLKAPVSAAQAKKSGKGGKAANRRKSFCARMGGMKGAMKDEKGRPTRKALALRKWDC